MLHFLFLIELLYLIQPVLLPPQKESVAQSAYLAFVDRDFMFTVEVVSPGVPILNFVCLDIDGEPHLMAKQVRLLMDGRKIPAAFFLIDTGDPKQPVLAPSLKMKPRSSFGVRLKGEYAGAREFQGAFITVGNEEFKLNPIPNFNFESLVKQINAINLESPDFSEDWQVLHLSVIGTRRRVRE
jgi:hypothetical protein